LARLLVKQPEVVTHIEDLKLDDQVFHLHE
jgi:hypothetical protein